MKSICPWTNDMSSKSDGKYEGNQGNNSKTNLDIGVREQSSENNKEDTDKNKFAGRSGVYNNTNTHHLATFSQPQTSKACQVGDNTNVSLKTISYTNTPVRQFNVNTTVYKMQPPSLPPQQYPSSQPPSITSKASSSMVGRYNSFSNAFS